MPWMWFSFIPNGVSATTSPLSSPQQLILSSRVEGAAKATTTLVVSRIRNIRKHLRTAFLRMNSLPRVTLQLSRNRQDTTTIANGTASKGEGAAC